MCGRSQIVSNPPADKAGGRLHGNHRRIDLRQELANLPTNEICRSAKDAMIPRLVEVARNPRRYTSHEIRNVILDAAALNRSDGLAWGLWQRTGPRLRARCRRWPAPVAPEVGEMRSREEHRCFGQSC